MPAETAVEDTVMDQKIMLRLIATLEDTARSNATLGSAVEKLAENVRIQEQALQALSGQVNSACLKVDQLAAQKDRQLTLYERATAAVWGVAKGPIGTVLLAAAAYVAYQIGVGH